MAAKNEISMMAGFGNDQLDAYLDLRDYTREFDEAKDLFDLYEASLALGVPQEAAEHAIRIGVSREFADEFFKDDPHQKVVSLDSRRHTPDDYPDAA